MPFFSIFFNPKTKFNPPKSITIIVNKNEDFREDAQGHELRNRSKTRRQGFLLLPCFVILIRVVSAGSFIVVGFFLSNLCGFWEFK